MNKNAYPCIKEKVLDDIRVVVLFAEIGCGTVIECVNSDFCGVGDYIEGWNEQEFKLFGGTIELRND